MKLSMWRAGGDWHGGKVVPYVYGFGYWTGEQGDLLCVKECKTNKEAEKYLSPLCRSRIIAFIKFIAGIVQAGPGRTNAKRRNP